MAGVTGGNMEEIIHSLPPEKIYGMGLKTGKKEGVRAYAWWKDGVQYVGTCGTTLKEALEKIDKEPL